MASTFDKITGTVAAVYILTALAGLSLGGHSMALFGIASIHPHGEAAKTNRCDGVAPACVSSQSQQTDTTVMDENGTTNRDGSDIWEILQGLSAPFVAAFTLVLIVVGWKQHATQRAQHVATHRPKLVVRGLRILPSFDTDLDTQKSNRALM